MYCAHVIAPSPAIHPPSSGSMVYKDDCMYCFDTPESDIGLDICLSCFQAFSRGQLNHTAEHSKVSNHQLYLNLKKTPKPKQELEENADEVFKKPKLEVRELSEEELFDIESKLYCMACDILYDDSPESVKSVIDGIMRANSSSRKEEIKTWEQEILPCEHSLYIEQFNNDTVDLTKCGACELDSNLWICIHCGVLGCGREQFGGIRGNSHALAHFELTGHPVAVKLGSLSQDSADCYCYHCNDEVRVPGLDGFLSKYGINISSHVKTEKNLIELQLDQNMNWEFKLDGENGEKLRPIFGRELTGFKNLGNSCYLNSAVQVLFQMKSYIEKFSDDRYAVFDKSKDPSKDLKSQMIKIADGLLSGRYSKPSGEDNYQRGLKPSSFKTLIGGNHEEFSTMRQQDAYEFWMYLVDKLDSLFNSEGDVLGNPNTIFKFLVENKLKCTNCGGVKLSSELVDNVSVPIEDKLIRVDEDGKKIYEPVELYDSFVNFTNDELIELKCPKCESNSFMKSMRFKSFPEVLTVNVKRIKLENWVPIKVDVPIQMPFTIDLNQFESHGLVDNEILLPEYEEQTDTPQFEPNQGAYESLLAMGFPDNRILKGLYAGNNSLDDAMNWLFAHMEDADIDEPFVVPQEKNGHGSQDVKEEDIDNLISMGFSFNLAKKALILNNNDINASVEWLFSNPDDDGIIPEQPQEINKNEVNDKIAEYLLKGDGSSADYRLKAVICHKGSSPHTGHYVVFINKKINGEYKWVLFNDEKVVVCDESNLKDMENTGYLYFFTRRGSSEDY